MAFALVGYPVVSANYLHQNDPFDQPPHPLLAQMLQIVASSQHHAQIATFMANMTADNQINYFNHSFLNGAVDRDIMEAAEKQAANIMKEAVENTLKTNHTAFITTSSPPSSSYISAPRDPYMSFGYLDEKHHQPQQTQTMNDHDDTHIITDPTQIEKYGYIPYLNYYYYHNDSDQQDNHDMMGVEDEDCLSDPAKAVQHQIDELETVCSSSSYNPTSPAIQVDNNVPENDHHYYYYHNENNRMNSNTNKSLFSGINRERHGHYYYDLFSDMPDYTRHANEVAQEERGRIWDPYYAQHNGDIPEPYSNNGSTNRYSHVSSHSGKDSLLTFHDEFPELPKREIQEQQQPTPPSTNTETINKLQKPSIDYASVVKRNMMTTKSTSSLQKTKVPNNNNHSDTPFASFKKPNNHNQTHPTQSFNSDAVSSCQQQNENICYETIMHNNNDNNSTDASPIQEITNNNKNIHICQQQQYMQQHMINNNNNKNGSVGVLRNDDDEDHGATHNSTKEMIKNQTITPHAQNAASTLLTKPKQVNNNNNNNATHVLNYAAIVKRNADVIKRKASSSPQCAPSKKIQKQNNDVARLSTTMTTTTIGLPPMHENQAHSTTLINSCSTNINNNSAVVVEEPDEIEHTFEKQQSPITTATGLKKAPEDAPQLIPSPQQQEDQLTPHISGANNKNEITVVPDSWNSTHKNVGHVTQNEQGDDDDSDIKAAHSSSSTIVTPYAEIARRSTAKKHPSFLNGGTASMRFRSSILSKYDRLEQQLVRPAVIPWVETGDPLTHLYQKERKQAKEFGVQMDRYFQLSQKYYHQRDWDNAKYYSDKGQYLRRRMHELHTRASQRIFEQRNQQDALFIDLHGMHVEEAKANIISWFHELKHYRGIVYIVTGTGHHSRRRRSTSSSIHSTSTTLLLNSNGKKEKKLRPVMRDFLSGLYRCEETSVHGDDKGGVFAVYLCPHLYIPNYTSSACVYCKFKNDNTTNSLNKHHQNSNNEEDNEVD
ncbi:hypothetical protein BDA99DRAFT_555174 [Phascolomyces articulosus]|uniref:Smr domain-containing protein n=1 Tax=Phascolomyces articulosus TaxID=60185 RepID=A0AAD5KQ82_9FUNG|nr:hypothetical protein BDA99DRAFT_555174 [Phascolomyces articulosus]